MDFKVLLISCATLFGSVHAQQLAKGVIFEDNNNNGKREQNEKGVAQVAVSNGREVVLTNTKGEYSLPMSDDNIIFVIKPRNFKFPVDQDNHPKFYYIHKAKGSPELKYAGTPATGRIPKSIDFPILPNKESDDFKAFVFGDPQAYNLEEIAYFKKGIIDDVQHKEGISFGISLGDLVGNDLSLHPAYKQAVGQLGLTWYNVMGNHDMNFDVKSDSLSDETYEKNFGPNNFSFNYGNTHFIVLDNIIYPNPRTGKGYLGGFREDQLDFVANDLKFVPKDKLIVLAFHIPLQHENSDVFRNEDRQRLFDLLTEYPHTLSLSAHTHFQKQNYYDQADGWKQAKPHHEYNVGTTSGDWYSGRMNPQGVPTSTMRDGTPKGYAILSINDNQYTFDYKVAGHDPTYQMNLIGPEEIQAKYVRRYTLYANFFIGKPDDKLQYRVDNGAWRDMEISDTSDPHFAYNVLSYDNTVKLLEGRRPSDPVPSSHLWKAKYPKLGIGTHKIEVKAIDMFGREHIQAKNVTVLE
ncbi:hypothetical protein FAZ19_16735 [Sphingobacterium alkalisoli]|uniref:Metallophosphoesterase n=1 Tax=Sphingobacterium alkalisoli TaxID=1874115 RepID=A0A4U0GXX9_9SPHI|nr:calcineurin-like phosphoesterase C-terminal domain-containing protein [Sphingobacterium alkalisoli]TJY63906.1 hypothetical protein FAZ19_16735 [Sphingobacterium alkalisoli]GGH24129.1 hypothetical protein GCM10011418_31820 [Sphingobacterium alkalisoli]